MNKLLFFASLFSLGLTFASAQVGGPITASTRPLARTTYEDKVSQDLRDIREQIEAVYEKTPQVGQAALASHLSALTAAEQALSDYRIASDTDLPARRADLEEAKARLARLWADYKQSHLSDAAAASNGAVVGKNP